MFKRKSIIILFILIITIVLTGCGETTANEKQNKVQKENKKQTTYYEDYNKLPELKNVIEFKKEEKTKSLTGPDEGKVTIKYELNDDDSAKDLVEKYLEFIEDYGFSSATTIEENSYSIIYNEYVVSKILYKDNQIELIIIPKQKQLSTKIIELKLNKTIKTDNYEFTLTKVEFSYDVKPSKTSGFYSSYQAEKGKVYINSVVKIKNLMQRNIRIEELYNVSAVYSDKYNYEGFTVVDDGNDFNWASSYSAASPLETAKTHGLIECPKELASSNSSLYVDFELDDGHIYRYTIR